MNEAAKRVLILGANGQLARNTTRFLLERTDARLTLYLRRASRLAGAMAQQARAIVAAMRATGLRRLIFISSMGIYGEVPGEEYRSVLDPYRDSAAVIEASDLDGTILRPGRFTLNDVIDYQLTRKGEPFRGHDVSLDSLSDLIVKLALSPTMELRRSLGVSRA